MTGLILKRSPIGWNQDDFDVVEDDVIVGRIFKVPIAPGWASASAGSAVAIMMAESFDMRCY